MHGPQNARRALEGAQRSWADVAVVVERVVTPEGVFLRCEQQPLGYEIRARQQAQAAGPGWGVYAPIPEGTQVVVVYPGGDMDAQAVCLGTLPNDEDTLPQAAQDHPDDLVLVTEAGANVRISAQGSGNVQVNGTGVYLHGGSLTVLGADGDLTPADGVVTGACLCPFTTLPHADKAAKVRAAKG